MQSPSHPSRANSFTFLRLVLALAVVFGHSFPLGGFGSDPFYWLCGGRLAIHELALQCFFILSGYLLMGSLALQPSLGRFALRRCFRIFPGYWVALLVAALGVAPAVIAHLYPGRFSYGASLVAGEIDAAHYLARNALLWAGQVAIPPLFYGNPMVGIVNGSLWTIFYEALCYAALALAAACGVLRRRNLVLGLFAALYLPSVVHAVLPFPVVSFATEWERIFSIAFHPAGPNLALPFAAGVAAHFLLRGRPAWNPRWCCIALAAFAVSLPLGAGRVFGPLVLPYLLISLGEKLPFQKWERVGDFSYGIYIYAFLIQQSLTQYGVNRRGYAAYLAASLALSIVAGVLSWFLIERPAIRLGGRLLAWIGAGAGTPARGLPAPATA